MLDKAEQANSIVQQEANCLLNTLLFPLLFSLLLQLDLFRLTLQKGQARSSRAIRSSPHSSARTHTHTHRALTAHSTTSQHHVWSDTASNRSWQVSLNFDSVWLPAGGPSALVSYYLTLTHAYLYPSCHRSGRPLKIRVNAFEVLKLPDATVHHYDVSRCLTSSPPSPSPLLYPITVHTSCHYLVHPAYTRTVA